MMRRCPRCGELLWRRTFDGVTVDGCRSCGGTWFDTKELEQVVQNPSSLMAVEQAFRKGEQPSVHMKATNLCPVCRQRLVPFRHPRFPSVTLDSCPTCRGVWADEGELAAIHQALQPPPSLEQDPTATKDLPIVRGYHLPEIRHSTGFLDQIMRGVAFLKSAFLLLRENPLFLIPVFVNMGVSVAILVLLGLGIWSLSGMALGNAFVDWLDRNQAVIFVALALWYVLTVLASFIFKGSMVSMVDAYLKGRPLSLSVALRDAFKNADSLVFLALTTIAVDILVSSAKRRSRGMLGIETLVGALAETIRTLWEVVTFLVLPIIIVEDVGFFDAIRRGKELYMRHLIPIAFGEIGIRFVVGLLSFVATLVAVSTVIVLSSLGIWGFVIGLASAVSLVAVVYAINAFVRAAYYTCLYLWAVEMERVGIPERVTVPAPLAAALAS